MFGKQSEKKRLEKELECLSQYRDSLNQALSNSRFSSLTRKVGFTRPLGTDESRVDTAFCRPDNDIHLERMLSKEGYIRLSYGFDRVLKLLIHADLDREDFRRREVIELFHDGVIESLSDIEDDEDYDGADTVLLRTFPSSNTFEIEYAYLDTDPDQIDTLAKSLLDSFANSLDTFYDDNEELLED